MTIFNKLYNLRTDSGQDPFFLYQEKKVTKRWLIQKIVDEIAGVPKESIPKRIPIDKNCATCINNDFGSCETECSGGPEYSGYVTV